VYIVHWWIVLRIRIFSQGSLKETKTHILFLINIFRKSCRWWNILEIYDRDRQATDNNVIWRMRFACPITKSRIQKHTHNIKIIIAFTQQKWLRKRASVLFYTCIVCLVWPCTTQYSCVNLAAPRSWYVSARLNTVSLGVLLPVPSSLCRKLCF
jgi:hypothetical protein